MTELDAAKCDLAEYFDYLDTLRASAVTNMFGARPYLMRKFNLDGDEAAKVLSLWMESDLSLPLDERVSIALDEAA